ncbi:MAG: DUF72 domain-containing protein [Lentisphaeraceae bacterium]|nr:DUF72 domain-containing protein [Lentisphaeraceae bacterium]
MRYYLGAPFWSFADWKGKFYSQKTKADEMLEQYSSVFNTVEAGSTFYANPKADSVLKWRHQVPDTFRFVFKIPKLITHQLMLQNVQDELNEFLKLMEPVHDVTGMFHIQLPPSFSAKNLPILEDFISHCPKHLPWALEVRHKDWFDEAENEQKLDDLLLKHGITRIHFNTEALFRKKPETVALKESWAKKPRNPDRWSVTTPNPAVRYISCDLVHESLKDASKLLQAAAYWIENDLKPYIFLHSPGNVITPKLCKEFHSILQRKIEMPDLNFFPSELNIQPELF